MLKVAVLALQMMDEGGFGSLALLNTQRTFMQRLFFPVLFATLASTSELSAQTFPSSVDICMQQDAGAGVLRISLRANDQDFGEVLSGLVFTIRWPQGSPATLGLTSSAWCPPGQAFNPGPSAQVSPGNGFKYKTWTSTGFALLNAPVDISGCAQTLLADTWTEVLTIPVINGASTLFQLVNDDFTLADNRDYFISLNGQWIANGDTLTGTICSGSTSISSVVDEAPFFRLAPNPTTGLVQIMAPSVPNAWCEVLDATGRSVMTQRLNAAGPSMLDLTGEAPGVYQVRVNSSEGCKTMSVVLERP